MKLVKCNQMKELSSDEHSIEISICGTIIETNQIPTKLNPNKFIRFITVEDETGTMVCVCFDKHIKKFDKLLRTNNQVIITGKKVFYSEDSPIIIQKVELVK